mgnify:CR=1 FL=1
MTATPMRCDARIVHDDFEASGCVCALRRLTAQMSDDFPAQFKRTVGSIPRWIYGGDFGSACAAVSVRDASEYARRFSRMSKFVKTDVYEEDSDFPAFLMADDERAGVELGSARSVARCRLLLGVMLEAYAVRVARSTKRDSARPGARKEFARLLQDAYFAALWTDAHVAFMVDTLEATGISEFPKSHAFVKNGAFGNPSIKRTLSISACPLLSCELDQYLNGHFPISEPLRSLMNLITRCNQSGARGWDTAVKSAMAHPCNANALFCILASACLGMHPNIHPSARMTWQSRMFVGNVLKDTCKARIHDMFIDCSAACKESVKIWMCSVFSDLPAMSTALAASGNSLGVLTCVPVTAPSFSIQNMSQNFVTVTLDAIGNMFKLGSYSHAPIASELSSGIVTENRTRRRGVMHPPKTADGGYTTNVIRGPEEQVVLAPSKNGNVGSNAVDVVGEMLSRAFRAEFLPMWIHGHGNGIRVGRLDPTQFDSMHNHSSCSLVTSSLSEAETVRLVHMAVNTPETRCEPINCVAEALGADREAVEELRKANGVEATIAVVARLPADVGCKLFTYCKIASLKNRMLAFDLGPATLEKQIRALKLRYNVPDDEDVVRNVPDAAYCLHYCMQCGKTANACVDCLAKVPKVSKSTKLYKEAAKRPAKQHQFDEIGIAQVMTRVGGVDETPHVRCAKRSSAALRTAVQKEADARRARVEEMEATPDTIRHGLRDGTDSSHMQRIRRDTQTCLLQLGVATACGDTPCVKFDLLGKAVRINGKFHSICTVCGSMMRVSPHNRLGCEICCWRCDPLMLSDANEEHAEDGPEDVTKKVGPFMLEDSGAQSCRFCNKPPPSANSKFKLVRAKSDRSPRNRNIPPPLRFVQYCPVHFRPWLVAAHEHCLDSRVITAHILEKAQPVLGAEAGTRAAALEMVHADVRRTIQKRKPRKLDKRIAAAKRRD